MDAIVDAITFIAEFITTDIYDLITNAMSYWIIKLTEASIVFMIWSIGFSWDIAQLIISDLGISSALQSSFNLLSNDALQISYYLKIPEMINIILTGAVTRYVLNFIPFV